MLTYRGAKKSNTLKRQKKRQTAVKEILRVEAAKRGKKKKKINKQKNPPEN